MKEPKNISEGKARDSVALVTELECLSGELEIAEDEITKIRNRSKTKKTSKKNIQRTLEGINAQIPQIIWVHQVYLNFGLPSNRRYSEPLMQLQPPNYLAGSLISVMKVNELSDTLNDQQ